jgi:hypothetical protein
MTLTGLLEIDRALLTPDERRGLALAELLRKQAGGPAEPDAAQQKGPRAPRRAAPTSSRTAK